VSRLPTTQYVVNILKSYKTGINSAANNGMIFVFKLLVEHGADAHKQLPLHVMAAKGDWKHMVDCLLAKGFDVNSSDAKQMVGWAKGTPMHHTLVFGGAAMENAKYLVEKGADLESQT
jgi:ankyrin repeat protein